MKKKEGGGAEAGAGDEKYKEIDEKEAENEEKG